MPRSMDFFVLLDHMVSKAANDVISYGGDNKSELLNVEQSALGFSSQESSCTSSKDLLNDGVVTTD